MLETLRESESGNAAQTLPPSHHAQDDSLQQELLEHVLHLRLILPVISISVMALRRQDAESDSDIACVLSEHACEPLDCEIERIERMLVTRLRRHRQQEVRA